MHSLKIALGTVTLGAALVAGTMAVSTTPARADVACNSYGECWHVQQRYDVTIYPHDVGVTYYGDDWRIEHEHDAHYHWLENHEGRGYYDHGTWVIVK
jgi:hypothetical protein